MRRSLILLSALLALSSCGNDEGTDEPLVRMSFQGHVWTARAQGGAVAYSVDHPDGGWIYTIAAREIGNGSQYIILTVPLAPEPGSFPLDGSVTSAAYSSCPDDILADCISFSAIAAHPGTLTIDHVDTGSGLVEGDFAFTGYALGAADGTTIAFTAGHFAFYAPSIVVPE